MIRIVHLIVFFAVSLTACASQKTPLLPTAVPKTSTLKARLNRRTSLPHPKAIGISGSCINSQGTWFVAERNQQLLQYTKEGKIKHYLIQGVPDKLDLEGLACTETTFYVSTEKDIDSRSSDVVLEVQFKNNTLQVVDQRQFHYPTGMLAKSNHGLEGLCIAGEWLIAASETLTVTSKGRMAPIFRQRLHGNRNTTLHWVRLSSDTGKLSGIDCRMSGTNIEVFAIERHYSVGRILHFLLHSPTSPLITVVDFAHIIRKGDNFESILVNKKGEVQLANDNQYKTISGPTEITWFETIEAFTR